MSKPASLEVRPDVFYWVRRRAKPSKLEIGRVSTVFGNDPEYWTLTRSGSEIHHMLDEFEFVAEAKPPKAPGQLRMMK
jgi:hypothetical protein